VIMQTSVPMCGHSGSVVRGWWWPEVRSDRWRLEVDELKDGSGHGKDHDHSGGGRLQL